MIRDAAWRGWLMLKAIVIGFVVLGVVLFFVRNPSVLVGLAQTVWGFLSTLATSAMEFGAAVASWLSGLFA